MVVARVTMVTVVTTVATRSLSGEATEITTETMTAAKVAMEMTGAASKAMIVNTMVAAMVVTKMTTTKWAGLRHRAVCTTVMEAN